MSDKIEYYEKCETLEDPAIVNAVILTQEGVLNVFLDNGRVFERLISVNWESGWKEVYPVPGTLAAEDLVTP